MRGMARAVAFGLAIAFLAGACGGAGTGGTAGTSSPAASAATRPKFEVQTFMYSIQVKGKLRVGTQEDNPPFSVKNPTNSKWEGFDTDIGREIAKAIFGTQGDPDSFIATDVAFHFVLAQIPRNPIFTSLHTAIARNALHADRFYVGVAFKKTELDRLQGYLGGTKQP